jgi:tetratricopeptide (TPR) repeat protein
MRSPIRRAAAILLFGGLGAPLPGCLNVGDDATTDPGVAAVPSTATEILTRHVEALGGEKALRAVRQRTVEARVTFLPQEGCAPGSTDCVGEARAGQFMLHTTADGRMFRRMVVGEVVSERGFDGKLGWELQGTPRTLILDDEISARASREDALLHWYLDWAARDIAPAIQSPRTTDHAGRRRDLDGIVWTDKARTLPPRQYWFDRLDGLLREEIEEDPASELRRTVVYDDYRAVDGVMVPHSIRQITQVGDVRQDVDIVVQRAHHGDVRAELFAVPRLPEPEPRVDDVLVALENARKRVEESPRDGAALFALASTAWIAGHFDEALAVAKRAAAAAPRDRGAPLLILGQAQLLGGDLAGAERSLRAAEKAGGHPQRIAHHLATLRLRQHRFRDAAELFRSAGETALADRYAAFEGKPLTATWSGKRGCRVTLPLVPEIPVPVVEARVDGETMRLLVDTSAADLIIDPERARKLGIEATSTSALGGEGGAKIGHGRADELVIGDLSLAAVPVDIFPEPVLAEMAADRRIEGVLGGRILQDMQVTIDLAAGEIELVHAGGKCAAALAANRKGASVPFWRYETHMLYVTGFMNGAEGLYLVNSGMRGAGVAANMDAFERAGVGAPVLKRDDPGAFVTLDAFRLSDAVAAEQVRAAWGYIQANATRDEFRFDGMVGLEVLGAYRWTIDFAQSRFYFAPSRAATAAPAPAAASPSPADGDAPRKRP